MNDNIESLHFVISYDENFNQFSVQSAETGCGYFVPRDDLVGDYRNFGEVLDRILDGHSHAVTAVMDNATRSEIDSIWEANIVLF